MHLQAHTLRRLRQTAAGATVVAASLISMGAVSAQTEGVDASGKSTKSLIVEPNIVVEEETIPVKEEPAPTNEEAPSTNEESVPTNEPFDPSLDGCPACGLG